MSKLFKSISAAMLVLGVATLLLFNLALLPAFAQGGAGDAIRNSVDPLYSSGEGENRVLTSNPQSLDPAEQDVYRFDYSGGNQPITVSLDSMPADAVQFQIWTDSQVTSLNSDPNTSPLGVGTPLSTGSEFSIWRGGDVNPQIFYVTVRSNANDTSRYLLNIKSAGLSPNQPGLATAVPLTTTVESTPPTPTVVPAGPTQTPTQTPVPNDTLVAAAPTDTPLPNVTVVTVVATATPLPNFTVVTVVATATPLPNVTVVPAAQPNTNQAVVIVPALNVRSGPSTLYPVITTVPLGTALTVLGRDATNTWIAVQLADGTQGWVTRTLTDYVSIASTVLTAEPLPSPTPIPGVTATPTPDTTIVLVQQPTPAALDGDWHVIKEGETQWYTFQYRGGGLPVHVWMDVDPDQGAIFNILDQETAKAILAGVAPKVVNAVGRGMPNPVEPGYLLWQADFPEADTYYVMVQYKGPGDVVYAIHAAGPGLSRPVPR